MLEELGNLGDFIGGVAVLVTLVYLALQIRQNTAQLRIGSEIARTEAYARGVESFSEYRQHLISNPEMAEVYLRGCKDIASLNSVERLRFHLVLQQLFNTLEAVLANMASTGTQIENPETVMSLDSLMKQPGVQAWWAREKQRHNEVFIKLVDSQIGRCE